MNEQNADSLRALRQHWHLQREAGLPIFDWLGDKIQGDWLGEQIEKERTSLTKLLLHHKDNKDKDPLVIGIAVPDGIANLVLGVALALEGITQAILPVTASATELRVLTQRFGLTHYIGPNQPIPSAGWKHNGITFQELQCWQNLDFLMFVYQ